ncbi:MAG: PEP-CTERM sorting domain-containing protein, partial [Akkermansiaceae bacterium]
FQHSDFSDPDILGINGASFQFRLTYDNTALRSFTNNLNTDLWDLSQQPGSSATLTISGSPSNDGTYQGSAATVYEGNGPFDDLAIDTQFDINGSELSPGTFMLPAGFTGAISATNTISAFSTSDLVDPSDLEWSISDYNFDDDTSTYIRYEVQSATISTIPEPTSAILLVISTTAFILRRGRKKTAPSRIPELDLPLDAERS